MGINKNPPFPLEKHAIYFIAFLGDVKIKEEDL
jgi:hypothetical protein